MEEQIYQTGLYLFHGILITGFAMWLNRKLNTQFKPNTKASGWGKSYGYIKQVKTKKIPIEIEIEKKDGTKVKIKTTKIVKDSQTD